MIPLPDVYYVLFSIPASDGGAWYQEKLKNKRSEICVIMEINIFLFLFISSQFKIN